MNHREVKEHFTLEDLRIDSSLTLSEAYGQCAIDEYIAIPIYHLSPRYRSNEEFHIELNQHPGYECWLLSCKGETFTYGEASAALTAAYLRDASVAEIQEGQYSDYIFKHDYVVVKNIAYAKYHTHYRESSAIWGGFTHKNHFPQQEKLSHPHTIHALSDLSIPTADHNTTTLRVVHDSTPLGHYLSLYHLIELSFDYDLLQDLQALGSDLKGFGKIIATYSNSEYNKLLRLVKKYWIDEALLEDHLRVFFSHSQFDASIDELLFEYEKDGFPWTFKDQPAKRIQFISHVKNSFSKSCLTNAKLGYSMDHYQRAATYIIYRFRCAIAHASIGEYILTINDSELVTKKAMPFLMGLINQIFKK
ncbi:hypothetical protein VP719_11905 [Pseudomonas protegens]|uniref:hypothetical protein n=1 Tax=Pseudomonas protegens TaxID=380021 RepID=UPI002DB84C2E|nr:hypothetical protein [Pseudomonas protegens]WRV93721.1 hypothetical protein VP719_11905 [Pseudomonas protegens]